MKEVALRSDRESSEVNSKRCEARTAFTKLSTHPSAMERMKSSATALSNLVVQMALFSTVKWGGAYFGEEGQPKKFIRVQRVHVLGALSLPCFSTHYGV